MNCITTRKPWCLYIGILVPVIILFSSSVIFAQTTISGKIIDSLTRQPLSSASVFLANESKSTTSMADGTFKINAVGAGKHTLIISYIGYPKFVKNLIVDGSSPVNVIASLSANAQTLTDVTVSAPVNPKKRAVLVGQFAKALFGNSENASQCKLLNPRVLKISFDKKNNILNAACDSFLIIRNNALGYAIHVFFDGFAYNYNNGTRNYTGKFYFSEISGSVAEIKKWNRKRAETYRGSIRQFLKAAVKGTLKQDGFIVHPIITLADTGLAINALIEKKVKQFAKGNTDSLNHWLALQQASSTHYVVNDKFLAEKDLMRGADVPGLYELRFDNHIYLLARNKQVVAPNGTLLPASTVLTLNVPKTFVDVNGILIKPSELISEGENTETIADLLPFDYELSSKDEAIYFPKNNSENVIQNTGNGQQYTEKLYVRTNRDLYLSGDTVWFSSYLLNAKNNRFTDHSQKLYVELISPANKLLNRRVLKPENGIAAGDFLLDDSLSTGIYRIRAYTNWIRNFGGDFIFEKEIEVKGRMLTSYTLPNTNNTKKIDITKPAIEAVPKPIQPLVNFYPESGSLIADVYARVAFTFTDSTGTPLEALGKIIDSAGDTICAARPDINGRGDFLLKPKAATNYYFVTKFNRIALPQVLPDGFSLFVQEKESFYNVLVSTNDAGLKKAAKKTMKLLVRHSGMKIAALAITPKVLQQSVRLPKQMLMAGVNVISLEDFDGRPLAERLVFCEPGQKLNVVFSNEKPVYQYNEKADVTLKVTDTSGRTVKGNASVSVIPKAVYNGNVDNVVSYLMLSSEIKGQVYNPAQYFDESNPDRKKQMELLLLTQGWRDYMWKYYNNTPVVQPKYMAEAGLRLNGTVRKNGGVVAANVPVSLHIPGANQQKLFITQTDSAGNYSFMLDEVYGNQAYTIAAINGKGVGLGEITVNKVSADTLSLTDHRKLTAQRNLSIQSPSLLTRMQNHQQGQSLENTVQRLNEVKVKATVKNQLMEGTFTSFSYKDEKFNITPADYTFNNLKHFLLTRSRYATQDRAAEIYSCSGDHEGSMCKHDPIVSKKPGKCSCGAELTLTITEARDRVMFAGDDSLITPLIFINGRQLGIRNIMRDADRDALYQQYLTLSMEDIQTVKVSKVLITDHTGTKLGYLLYIDMKQETQGKNGKLNGVFDGYYQAKVYAPVINKGPASVTRPFKELYWEPCISTGEKDSHKFSFYNSGAKGEYIIVVEGLTEAATPFYKTFEYKVQ